MACQVARAVSVLYLLQHSPMCPLGPCSHPLKPGAEWSSHGSWGQTLSNIITFGWYFDKPQGIDKHVFHIYWSSKVYKSVMTNLDLEATAVRGRHWFCAAAATNQRSGIQDTKCLKVFFYNVPCKSSDLKEFVYQFCVRTKSSTFVYNLWFYLWFSSLFNPLRLFCPYNTIGSNLEIWNLNKSALYILFNI